MRPAAANHERHTEMVMAHRGSHVSGLWTGVLLAGCGLLLLVPSRTLFTAEGMTNAAGPLLVATRSGAASVPVLAAGTHPWASPWRVQPSRSRSTSTPLRSQDESCSGSGGDLAAVACQAAARLTTTSIRPAQHPDSDDRIARALFDSTPEPASQAITWIGDHRDRNASTDVMDLRLELLRMAVARHGQWTVHCPCPMYALGGPGDELHRHEVASHAR